MILWDIARASAFVAFGCYTVSVAWGIVLAGRGWRPAAPQLTYHRFLASLGMAALVVHVTTLLLDPYAHIPPSGLAGIGVRGSVVLGALALWLGIALPLSFRLKRWQVIGARAWRRFHYFGYAAWALMLCHGIAAGTDSRSLPAIAVYAAAAAVVAAAAWWRWLERPEPAVRRAGSR